MSINRCLGCDAAPWQPHEDFCNFAEEPTHDDTKGKSDAKARWPRRDEQPRLHPNSTKGQAAGIRPAGMEEG